MIYCHADGCQHLVTKRVGAYSARNPDMHQDDFAQKLLDNNHFSDILIGMFLVIDIPIVKQLFL